MSFDAAEEGTRESVWSASGYRERATPLDIGAVRRLVVVAAHPDDETLMAGALVAAVAATGRPVEVVVATDGAGSHPGSPTFAPAALAAVRAEEVLRAVQALGVRTPPRLLGLPDGGLAEHEAELHDALAALVRPGDTVVATWRHDGHRDHEAAGRAAAEVAASTGAVLLEAPVWAWHWGGPGLAASWPAALRFDPPAAALAAKAAATALHASQVAPLSPAPGDEVTLLPAMLEHFRGAELFFPGGAVTAVDFDAMYAATDDPWGFDSRWYERRKRAITVASLPVERYRRVLEIGCSTGVLTAALAERADAVLATDVAARAVELAGRRFAADPRVSVEQRRLPEEWPAGSFDLVVLSETGFYLAGEALPQLAARIGGSLAPGGAVLLCHWRPRVVGLDRGGDEVHATVAAGLPQAVRLVHHVEDDFVLDLLQLPPALSVARATGLR